MIPPLLVTRPLADARRFAGEWRARAGVSAPVVLSPVTGVRPLTGWTPPTAGETPILTSAHAIIALGSLPAGHPCWCVGSRTAAAAAAAGLAPRSADGDSDRLVAAILSSGETAPLVHVRGRESRGEVATRLRDAGLACREIVVYAQDDLPLNDEAVALLGRPGRVLVPLFSPQSARRLVAAMAPIDVGAALAVAALSPAVADAWIGPAVGRVAVAAEPTSASLCDALVRLADSP